MQIIKKVLDNRKRLIIWKTMYVLCKTIPIFDSIKPTTPDIITFYIILCP